MQSFIYNSKYTTISYNMFKKKNNTKKIDLTTQADDIIITPNNTQIHEPTQPPIKPTNNNLKLQFQLNIQQIQSIQHTNASIRQQQKLEQSDMLQCFSELKKMKNDLILQQQQYREQDQLQGNKMIDIDDMQYNGYKNERQSFTDKIILIQQNLQEQYGSNNDMLEIEIDQNGAFSPQSNYQEINIDYQNDLIKKILTKQNYQKIQANTITTIKINNQKITDHTFDSIMKVDEKKIKHKIDKDIQQKRNYLNKAQNNLLQLTKGDNKKKKQIEIKLNRIQQMERQMNQLQKIIEHIYYYGDSIEQFSYQNIVKQIMVRQNMKNQRKNRMQEEVWQM